MGFIRCSFYKKVYIIYILYQLNVNVNFTEVVHTYNIYFIRNIILLFVEKNDFTIKRVLFTVRYKFIVMFYSFCNISTVDHSNHNQMDALLMIQLCIVYFCAEVGHTFHTYVLVLACVKQYVCYCTLDF